jgi:GAF domain-containing protein
VHIPEVAALPKEAAAERREFQCQDIQSLLCLPIYDDQKKLIGFMGFDAVRSPHEWPADQIIMLQMLAEILGSAIFRLEAMQALALSETRLQKANAEKDKLLAIIAHDLRSPVSGLVAATELLATGQEDFSEQYVRLLSEELLKPQKTPFCFWKICCNGRA